VILSLTDNDATGGIEIKAASRANGLRVAIEKGQTVIDAKRAPC
jgi:hypothetical protein